MSALPIAVRGSVASLDPRARAVLFERGSASDPAVVRTVSYNATKHGVVGMTRQLAAEWGAKGITVNAICPGFFPSKMTQAMLDATGAIVLKGTPTGRLGGPDDLKGLAVLLASEASRHITGQAIAVDGGATLI